jgi:putative oxidoreductase
MVRDFIDLLGRIFLSAIFIFEACDTIWYFERAKRELTAFGVTGNQDTILYFSAVFLTLGGLMVLVGYRATLGSFLLLCYWIPMTLITHDFWNAPKDEFRLQSILFMKDVAIIGGLLMLVGKGSGRFSIKRVLATTKVSERW